MMLTWCIVAFLFIGFLASCFDKDNPYRSVGWGVGLVAALLASTVAKGAEHSILVEPAFSVSVTSHNDVLALVPNTCGEVKLVEILTDPPATHHRYHHKTGTYACDTTAMEGIFRCVVCQNDSCTPIEYHFTATLLSGDTPTGVGVNAPNYWWLLIPFSLILLVLAAWVVYGIDGR